MSEPLKKLGFKNFDPNDLQLAATNLKLIILVSVTIPPFILIVLLYLSYTITAAQVSEIFSSWVFYLTVIPIAIISVFFMSNVFDSIIQLYEQQKDKQLKNMYRPLFTRYLTIMAILGVMVYPIALSVSVTSSEIAFALVMTLFLLAATVAPLLIRYSQEIDRLYQGIPVKRYFSVNKKFQLTVLFSVVGGLGALTASAYSIAWRFLNFPEWEISVTDVLLRVILIGLIMFVLQALPNLFTGLYFSKQLVKIRSFATDLARKELTTDLNVSSRDEFGHTAQHLLDLKADYTNTVQKLTEASSYLNSASADLRAIAQQYTTVSQDQSGSTKKMEEGVNKIIQHIGATNANAQQTREKGVLSEESMMEGKTLVEQTRKNIVEISDNVKLIEEIVGQTNMLAINAGIEASSAGQYGKGFIEVANEVKSLADSSKEIAQQIKEKAASSLDVSNKSTELVMDVAKGLEENLQLSSKIAEDANAQNERINNIYSAINQFASVSEEISSSSGDLIMTSVELEKMAKELEIILSTFRLSTQD